MSKLHIISSIQDSLGTNLRTIVSIIHSETTTRFRYTVYNDFSSHETTSRLQSHTATEFMLVKLLDITQYPSSHYMLVLQAAQQKTLAETGYTC